MKDFNPTENSVKIDGIYAIIDFDGKEFKLERFSNENIAKRLFDFVVAEYAGEANTFPRIIRKYIDDFDIYEIMLEYSDMINEYNNDRVDLNQIPMPNDPYLFFETLCFEYCIILDFKTSYGGIKELSFNHCYVQGENNDNLHIQSKFSCYNSTLVFDRLPIDFDQDGSLIFNSNDVKINSMKFTGYGYKYDVRWTNNHFVKTYINLYDINSPLLTLKLILLTASRLP